jgi:hypothetical protein
MRIFDIPRSPDELERLVHDNDLTESQARVINCVTHFAGFSLENHGAELGDFLSRQRLDEPAKLTEHVGDSGLFGLAVWHALGVQHQLIKQPYVVGFAIPWLYEIAKDLGAIRHPMTHGLPKPGALLHYFTDGQSDNHVAFCLTDVRAFENVWIAFTGGAGPDGTIATGHVDIKRNAGKPLQEWYDIDALLPTQGNAHEDPNDRSDVSIRSENVDTSQGSSVAETKQKARRQT